MLPQLIPNIHTQSQASSVFPRMVGSMSLASLHVVCLLCFRYTSVASGSSVSHYQPWVTLRRCQICHPCAALGHVSLPHFVLSSPRSAGYTQKSSVGALLELSILVQTWFWNRKLINVVLSPCVVYYQRTNTLRVQKMQQDNEGGVITNLNNHHIHPQYCKEEYICYTATTSKVNLLISA